jgi:hypothetical protein
MGSCQHMSYFSRQDGTTLDDHIDQCILTSHQSTSDPSIDCSSHTLWKKDPKFSQLRPLFGWLSPDLIKKTFMHTTQYARLPTGTTLKRALKSPNPALNFTRCNVLKYPLFVLAFSRIRFKSTCNLELD